MGVENIYVHYAKWKNIWYMIENYKPTFYLKALRNMRLLYFFPLE